MPTSPCLLPDLSEFLDFSDLTQEFLCGDVDQDPGPADRRSIGQIQPASVVKGQPRPERCRKDVVPNVDLCFPEFLRLRHQNLKATQMYLRKITNTEVIRRRLLYCDGLFTFGQRYGLVVKWVFGRISVQLA